MTFSVTNAATSCNVCDLEKPFNDANGYSCFRINDDNVACTCPDRRYKLNKPCRICDRPNICGDNPENICSEISPTSLGTPNNTPHNFACFCADLSYHLGTPCPSNITPTPAPA